MMKSKVICILALAMVSACTCAKTPDLPDVDPESFVRYASNLSVESKILGRNMNFDILLPADYLKEPDKRYPVVYMCHGLGDNNTSWNDKWLRIEEKVGTLEEAGLEPMIYVFPNANRTYYCNKYNGKFAYMDYFVQELVPHIDKVYRTKADREHRATVGYSMGGFGAYVLAAKHPEVFSISAPLSMSFRTDEQYMTESQDGWNYQWASVFGGENAKGTDRLTDYYKEHCPLYVFDATNRGDLDKVHWFLHCGDDEEQLLIANDDLHVLMRDNGYKHEYRVADGAHTSGYWRNALEEVLPYIQSVFNGNTDWTMTLKEANPVDVTLDANGVFCSSKYTEQTEEVGTSVYIAHAGLDAATLKSVISIMQRTTFKNYIIVPCNVNDNNLESFVEATERKYHAGKSADKRAVLAIGDAGKKAISARSCFATFFLEDASIPEGFGAEMLEAGKFYFIGQTDESEHYREAGILYKTCKKAGMNYQYRCRNNVPDKTTSLLIGIETMKTYLSL